MHQGLSVAVRLIAFILLIAVFCLGIIFLLAGMTDVVGSWLAAVAIFLVVAAAIAAIILAAHRSQAAAGTVSKTETLSDWTWSIGMVVGATAVGFLASFVITALLFSQAEHGSLPAGAHFLQLAAPQAQRASSGWSGPRPSWVGSYRSRRGSIAMAWDKQLRPFDWWA